jgi:hypothetical protein
VSGLDDIVTALSARYADASVAFEFGQLALNHHAQQRRIVFVRTDGVLKFSSGPGRTTFSTPVNGAGTYQRVIFERDERISVTIRGETESQVEIMLDQFVDAVFAVCGPNALGTQNEYQWAGGDSTNAGANSARNPSLTFSLVVRLKSRPPAAGPYVQLAPLRSTITLGTEVQPITPSG